MPFTSPNYTQIPNDLLGHVAPKQEGGDVPGLMVELGYSGLMVVLALCRLTFGFHKTSTFASLSRLQLFTGLGRQHVLKGAELACEMGLFAKNTEHGVTQYTLVTEGNQVVTESNQGGNVRLLPSKKETKKETSLPVPEKAQGTEGDYFTMNEWAPEYHELEEERARPKWVVPENTFQRQVLSVCGAKWFKPKQKTLVKKLAKCLDIGAILSEAACLHRCLDELRNCENFPERPLAMPVSWLEWREDHARSNRWSVQGFINSLFDRDALVRHCRVMLKKKGIKPSAADEEIPEGMVRVLSEEGVSLITEEEAERRTA